MNSRFFVIFVYYLLILCRDTMCQDVCEDVSCYGDAFCHQGEVTQIDGTKKTVPKCVNSDACEDVTCFGDARCKVVNVVCYTNGNRCDLPRCGDKDTKDYEADVKSAIDVEALVKTSTYINSQDQGVLCQGMNCWGSNKCIIVDVKKLKIVSKFLPLCDDSPTPAMLKLSILR
ncbi:hypothetical protein L3Y34_008747 [Caenorhabditis briggsae]|uniref:Uncharacterized protein n=1 Tax=Caenorhabditis briggsae TaxID=6238 RepID=A0AAE9AAG1_CAEBR|nr:hypothetical protein L3Y34_008747 [Caenorhabditis briggsae]